MKEITELRICVAQQTEKIQQLEELNNISGKHIHFLEGEISKIAKAVSIVSKYIDCGDNSCLFADKIGGMRTNGGCRCRDRPYVVSALSKLYRTCRDIIIKE